MARDNQEMEVLLQAALREEAGELWPPRTLWPRLEACLTRPVGSAPSLQRLPIELRTLIRRGDLRHLTLALLADGEMDGFTLARHVEDLARAAGCSCPREGALLPVVHRLEAEGLLDARWRPAPPGLRRAYNLSARGRRVRRRAWLVFWLAEPRARLWRVLARQMSSMQPGGEH